MQEQKLSNIFFAFSEEKEQEIEKRTLVIINELMGDDLPKLIQMSKGRSVIARTLKAVGPKEQARIVLALMSIDRGLVNKKLYGDVRLIVFLSPHVGHF